MGAGGTWGFAHLTYIGGGRLVKFDPWSGAVVRNISIAPLTTGTLYMEPYVLSVQTINATAGQYRLINWSITDFTQTGALVTLDNRIANNITWPFSSLGTVDFEAGVAVSTYSIMHDATGVAIDVGIMAASLTTGQLLWNVSSGVGFGLFSGSTAVADHGKFTVRFNDGYWHCWNLQDGKKLWKSESEQWPWSAFGAYNIASAYGYIFDLSYAGIYAIDWNTGKIAWRYDPGYPGYEAAFGNYPFFTNPVIADGKLYVANGEHSPTEPLMRGWNLHCINATTGEGLWNVTGGGTVGAVADGYITFDSRYDGYMYVFGKGESATTVSAPQTAITQGQSLVLTGTVLDQSPGQTGTPCVSKDSMGPWMDYLHMQAPIPANVIGVPVSLDAVDPNGNAIHIATVTSDMSGTFGYTWQPEIAGQYTVTATFMGDDSYGSSWAQTYATVTQAPESTPTPTAATSQTPTELYFACSTIAIIIAIAVAAVLILRKKP
ncbi:MAG: PQQ-like beta-propeller repeat protein [Planctomycetes bacterium]|nr:PQQ-like beta-propeller repeat protein [Planctomycetota bacterium]